MVMSTLLTYDRREIPSVLFIHHYFCLVWTYSISKNESVQSPVHELCIFIQFYFTVLMQRMLVGIYNFVNKLVG